MMGEMYLSHDVPVCHHTELCKVDGFAQLNLYRPTLEGYYVRICSGSVVVSILIIVEIWSWTFWGISLNLEKIIELVMVDQRCTASFKQVPWSQLFSWLTTCTPAGQPNPRLLHPPKPHPPEIHPPELHPPLQPNPGWPNPGWPNPGPPNPGWPNPGPLVLSLLCLNIDYSRDIILDILRH